MYVGEASADRPRTAKNNNNNNYLDDIERCNDCGSFFSIRSLSRPQGIDIPSGWEKNWPIQSVSSKSSLEVFCGDSSREGDARSAPEQNAALGPGVPPVITITLMASSLVARSTAFTSAQPSSAVSAFFRAGRLRVSVKTPLLASSIEPSS